MSRALGRGGVIGTTTWSMQAPQPPWSFDGPGSTPPAPSALPSAPAPSMAMGRCAMSCSVRPLSVRVSLSSCRGEMRVPYETSLPTYKETQIHKIVGYLAPPQLTKIPTKLITSWQVRQPTHSTSIIYQFQTNCNNSIKMRQLWVVKFVNRHYRGRE